MIAKARYIAQLLEHYQQLPGTLRRLLRDDRRTARALHQRRIGLEVVHQAFVLALARRTFGPGSHRLEPIRALRYFLPVIAEILDTPPDPAYLQHLERRLREAGLGLPPSNQLTATRAAAQASAPSLTPSPADPVSPAPQCENDASATCGLARETPRELA